MEAAVTTELSTGIVMVGDSVVLCEGSGSDGRVGWSDEDYDAGELGWSTKNRRHQHPHHRLPRPPDKRSRLTPAVDGSVGSSSVRSDHVPETIPLSSYSYELQVQPSEVSELHGTPRNGNGSALLQKQNCVRGSSNSLSGEVTEMGSTVVDSSSGNGSASSTVKVKGTGSIFFKTKLCCKFRVGTCPYNSNCNFAHGMEELRKPPPGWEEMVAAQEAERASRGSNTNSNSNTHHQIQVVAEPSGGGSQGDSQRFHKTPRPCRKFYTEDGCPYGDRCIFMHDEQMSQGRTLRESNAISLGPVTSQSSGTMSASGSSDRLLSWKNRVCNKWETTGHCPFGQKCHFVHVNSDGSVSSLSSRHGATPAIIPQGQRQVSKAQLKWKGPANQISTIYGDWIEEDEWEGIIAG
ncbi:hypothetical protein KP509_10G007100 [Ceratopteris richardii]|uniref:C3H1-type domain-containing protein n=1 Tax=Ceratopteris richardii TaxID=49495 RepID=A0A8T2TYS5_CERRI|nr:hypothetical protein KP509_10G007100 [Ceratopteris richardii]